VRAVAHTAGQAGLTESGAPIAGPHGYLSGLDLLRLEHVVEPPPVLPSGRFAGTLRRYGRIAIWALPLYAVLAGLVTLRDRPVLPLDPDWRGWALMFGSSFLGLVGLTALAALLAGTRTRRLAGAALAAGLAGTVLLLPLLGTLCVQEPALGKALLHGTLRGVVIGDRLHGRTAAVLVLTGAALLTVAWLLTGVAVVAVRLLNVADGVLLMIAAPLLFLGGLVFRPLPALGAVLLLAAGFGLAWTAARLAPEEPPATTPTLAIAPGSE
jgi:hypothetical protein